MLGKKDGLRIALSTAVIFTIVTSVFTLANNIGSICISLGFKKSKSVLNTYDIIWLILMLAVIIILLVLCKKFNINGYHDMVKNSAITLTSGLLIIIKSLPQLLLDVYGFITDYSQFISNKAVLGNMSKKYYPFLYSDIFGIVIMLLQILVGIYLMKLSSKNENTHPKA